MTGQVEIEGVCCCGINLRHGLIAWTCFNILANLVRLGLTIMHIIIVTTAHALKPELDTQYRNEFLTLNGTQPSTNLIALNGTDWGVSLTLVCVNILTNFLLLHSVYTDNVKRCKLWSKIEWIKILLGLFGALPFEMVLQRYGGSIDEGVNTWFLSFCIVASIYMVHLADKFVEEVETKQAAELVIYNKVESNVAEGNP